MRAGTVLLIGLWALAGTVGADVTVYRVVDEDGHVSYSDRPPAQGPAEALSVAVEEPLPSPEVEARRKAMRDVTERLAEERLARDQARAEADRAVVPYAMPESSGGSNTDERWLPVYSGYYPGYGPRPPGYRPPPRPRPVPQPNPDSHSPRGLQQRLENAR